MAGNGPPPNKTRSRARDTGTRQMVTSDGLIGGFDLPDDVLPFLHENHPDYYPGAREQWNAQTVRWWENFRRSPQATLMVTAVDWDYLLDTALMHHIKWESGGRNSERDAEIRIRVAAFGATPADRLRLKLEIDSPPAYDVGNAPKDDNITSLNERRSRMTGS